MTACEGARVVEAVSLGQASGDDVDGRHPPFERHVGILRTRLIGAPVLEVASSGFEQAGIAGGEAACAASLIDPSPAAGP